MPLRKGSSQSVVSSNIKTLVDDWKRDGSIGASHPPTKKKAIMQMVTSSVLGVFRDSLATREEFLSLIGRRT